MENNRERENSALNFFNKIEKITQYIKDNITDKPLFYSYILSSIALLCLIFSPNALLTNASFILLLMGISSIVFFQLSKIGEEYEKGYYEVDQGITPESDNWYGYENNWPTLENKNTLPKQKRKTFEQIWNPPSIEKRPNT